MSDHAATPSATDAHRSRPTPLWVTLGLAVVFGLFYAWDIWEAVGNLVGLSITAAELDTSLSAFGWTILVAAVVMPAVVFALALWLGRRRSAGIRALLLVAGLCLSAVLSLDLYVAFGFGSLIV